jgi:hypothetical protein
MAGLPKMRIRAATSRKTHGVMKRRTPEMTIGWTKMMIRKRMTMMTMTKLGLGQVRRGETGLLFSLSYRSRRENADDHVYRRRPDPN